MPDRMIKQIQFMNESPDAVLCGTNARLFNRNAENRVEIVGETRYPAKITTEDECSNSTAFIHHATLCLRKSAIGSMGYEGVVPRVFQRYGVIYNLTETLVLSKVNQN
jgi:hypothetical protein